MNYIGSLNNSNEIPNEKIIEKTPVEAIPMCMECLFEFQSGDFICHQCKINLCQSHLKQHYTNNPEHNYIQLILCENN